MYNINLNVLGHRLKQIREHLKLSQVQLADKMECKQNAISNLELGKGGSINLLFNILNFYSDFVFIDSIFSEKFYLISNVEHEVAQKSQLNTVVAEILKQGLEAHKKKLEEDLKDSCSMLDDNIFKALNLLVH